jgi:hypothetical protein
MGCGKSSSVDHSASSYPKKHCKDMTRLLKFYEENIEKSCKKVQEIYAIVGPVDISKYLPFDKVEVENDKNSLGHDQSSVFTGYSSMSDGKQVIIRIYFNDSFDI